MKDEPINVLLIEDNPGDARLLREMVAGVRGARFELEWADRLSAGLEGLARGGIDVVLLDLSLPDSQGVDTIVRVQAQAPGVPIVVLTSLDDESLTLKALQEGAQDYLVKGSMDSKSLLRSLRYAIERHRMLAELEKTNAKLLQLTLELEARVEQRTIELRAKSEEVTAMSQQLWQAAKLATMGELAASIAHELNNPLATVSLRVESLLEQTPAADPRQRALEVIAQEVERMGTLVANLLQFSRRSQPQISTIDVCAEIASTLELIHYHLRNRHITVAQEFAPAVPMVHADRQQLRQLFLNLFTNASDAMPQGGTLTIWVDVAEPPTPPQVVIEIADTGVGIAPADVSKVMEPFFTTKPEGKGTGLGLPICRRIVQEHGGTFDIASQVGQGTTVRIALPVTNGGNAALLRET